MEFNEQLKKLEYAVAGLETISQIVYDSPIDDNDKQHFTEILARAYKKGDELSKSISSY